MGTKLEDNAKHKSVLVFSFHNWVGKRQGGFHKLAEAFCRYGCDVDFVSFPRPYYGILKSNERVNAQALTTLCIGKQYNVHNGTLFNFTCPTLGLPGPIQRLCPIPKSIVNKLEMTSFPSLISRIRRRKKDYSFLFFDSYCLRLYPAIRRLFPSAKLIFRASDVDCHGGDYGYKQAAERFMLKEADDVFVVNDVQKQQYLEAYPEIDYTEPRFHTLPNGVDIEPYQKKWDKPSHFRDRPTALFIGAANISWDLILYCADNATDIDFHIVTPIKPSLQHQKAINSRDNIFYVPGVSPSEVPRYVTNSDVSIVPYAPQPLLKSVRLHAKLLQAIAACKPIVVANLSSDLAKYGIMVAKDKEEFLHNVRQGLAMGKKTYSVDLEPLSWTRIQDSFASTLNL